MDGSQDPVSVIGNGVFCFRYHDELSLQIELISVKVNGKSMYEKRFDVNNYFFSNPHSNIKIFSLKKMTGKEVLSYESRNLPKAGKSP